MFDFNIYSYNYEELTKEIMKFAKTNDKKKVEKILNLFGSKVENTYIIFHQEGDDETDNYSNISKVIDIAFNVEDSFFKIFENEKLRNELISETYPCDIESELNIDIY